MEQHVPNDLVRAIRIYGRRYLTRILVHLHTLHYVDDDAASTTHCTYAEPEQMVLSLYR